MSNVLRELDGIEREKLRAVREMEQRAKDDEYQAYLDKHRERVRQDCGNDNVFEQCTWWSMIQAELWLETELRADRHPHSATPHVDGWPGWASVMFMRDRILPMWRPGYKLYSYPRGVDHDERVGAAIPELFVVGEHRSKGNQLPVMQFQIKDVMVTARFNFHDWKVSVRLPECLDLKTDLLDIVDGDDHLLHPVYFEGFPDAYIFPSLSANDYPITAQFSVMFGSDYKMWTFFWLLKRWYDGRFGPIDEPLF